MVQRTPRMRGSRSTRDCWITNGGLIATKRRLGFTSCRELPRQSALRRRFYRPAAASIDSQFSDYVPNWKDIPITLRRQRLVGSLWYKVGRSSRLRVANGTLTPPSNASQSRPDCISFCSFLILKFAPQEREMFCLQKFHTSRRSRIARTRVRLLRLWYHTITKSCAVHLQTIFTSRFARN